MSELPEPKNQPPPPEEKHGCEHCLCCACERTCTRCHNCSPMSSQYIPLIGCKDFIDMRKLEPLRYIYYSSDRSVEYKLHLKLPYNL